MSKTNLNDAKETIGSAAKMIYGTIAGTLAAIDPDSSQRMEMCINVRQMGTDIGNGKYFARWELRWMDETTKKIHSFNGNLLMQDHPPFAFWDSLERVKQQVLEVRKKLDEEKGS